MADIKLASKKKKKKKKKTFYIFWYSFASYDLMTTLSKRNFAERNFVECVTWLNLFPWFWT